MSNVVEMRLRKQVVPLKSPKLIETFITDIGTLVGDFVVINGAGSVTKIADNSAAVMPNGVFGVVYSKPNNLTADVLFTGIIEEYSGLTAGLPLFIGATGDLTHTPPATGVVQQVGFAISASGVFIQLMQAMRRS